MKPALQLKLSQHLVLTPQLQQSIRLLQLSTLELNQEIANLILENPLLEREEDAAEFFPGESLAGAAPPESSESSESSASGDMADRVSEFAAEAQAEWPEESGGATSRNDHNDEDVRYAEIQAAAVSLRDHLGEQLAMMALSEPDRGLVQLLIEALDEDGYLSQDLQELAELLPAESGLDIEDLQIALKHLQHFDPPGIGARNVSECLVLQLEGLPESPARESALEIARHHLEWLAARDFVRLKKTLACNEDALREAQALIQSLNPRPGAAFSQAETRYVVPDVVVRKLRGQWVASLNGEAMPRLRINRLYADILQGSRGSGLSGQLQEARWLIKNVQQRFETILRVSQAIVDRQRAFFDHGEVAMRPLTLREIADQLELHESTISRVTTQKYMASPRGVFELKYFFGSHVATDTGGAASSTAIRALIRQLVGAENGKKPLSDSRLAEILGEQGIVVARRTVAKYRESLNIPAVNLRKVI